jgi:hypothetical protein
MKKDIDRVLMNIANTYRSEIRPDSRYYIEVDIGKYGEKLGFLDMSEMYQSVNAIVPVEKPAGAMRVRIDGRTFVNYVQFDTGVAVPGYVAENSKQRHRAYIPQDSMILGFASA